MREIDFLDAVGKVDEKYIEECISYKSIGNIRWIKSVSAVAASFAFIIAAVLVIIHINQPVIIDENGFYIKDGVLLSYTGENTDVTIPETVKTIADYTFFSSENAKNIKTICIGANVQNIEVNAFAGLENLVDIIISANNYSFVYENGLIMSSDGSILLRYEREGEKAFTIPDTVRYVMAHAVQSTGLEEINFGNNLEYIGYYAFSSNYKLKSIFLPETVKYIGEGAFSGCSYAVDGYIPKDAMVCEYAFNSVSFYNSILAGSMCPMEEIVRGLVTPSEAIVKSDIYSLTEQISYALAVIRGDSDYKASEAARFAHGAVSEIPKVPDDLIAPKEFTLEDLQFVDNGWGGTGISDIQIILKAGDYQIIMEAYGYGLSEELFWSESRFRLSLIYFVKDISAYSPDEIIVGSDWTAITEKDGEYYKDITFIHDNGTIMRYVSSYYSAEPYTLTYSPDGSRVAIEYKHIDGDERFYVFVLNSDRIVNEVKCVDYMNGYFGEYTPGSIKWIDNNNLEGINQFGRFTLNLKEGLPVLFADEPYMTDPDNDRVKEVTHNAIDHKLTVNVPEVWLLHHQWLSEYYYDAVQCGQYRINVRANVLIEGKYYNYLMEGKTDDEWLTNKNGTQYMVISYEEALYDILFGYNDTVVCDMRITRFAEDPDDYFETVIQPIIDSAVVTPDNASEKENYVMDISEFFDWIYATGDADAYPQHSYTVTVTGLATPVVFEMDYSDNPVSITAYDTVVYISDLIHFYGGNSRIHLFEVDGAIIFSGEYYSSIGYTYIIGNDFVQTLIPGEKDTISLFKDESGKLCYKRMINDIASIHQTGGLSIATGYDDFLYCIGFAKIENGTLVFGDAEESYSIGDVYDLDKEFNEGTWKERFGSIEEVFEENRNAKEQVRD